MHVTGRKSFFVWGTFHMARATDGATGSAIGKPARMPQAKPARPPRPALARRTSQLWGEVVQFLRDVLAEMKRVIWPDRKMVIASSVVVVFVMVVTALYLSAWDLILAKLFEQLLKF